MSLFVFLNKKMETRETKGIDCIDLINNVFFSWRKDILAKSESPNKP